jgi:hypothetical protein
MKGNDIVGRGTELEAIDHFLDRLQHEPTAIVFEGEPGIGKTTVWQQVFERAGCRSLLVLSCRPLKETRGARPAWVAPPVIVLPSVLPPLARALRFAVPRQLRQSAWSRPP